MILKFGSALPNIIRVFTIGDLGEMATDELTWYFDIESNYERNIRKLLERKLHQIGIKEIGIC